MAVDSIERLRACRYDTLVSSTANTVTGGNISQLREHLNLPMCYTAFGMYQ